MSEKNKETVERANVFVAAGKSEEFSMLFREDAVWTLLADAPSQIKGREAIRAHMTSASGEASPPPTFTVDNVIAEGDLVVSSGEMTMRGTDGETTGYAFCDIYRFQDGKIAELRTFINKTQAEAANSAAA